MEALFIYYRYPLYPQGSYFQEFLNRLAKTGEKVCLITSHYPKGSFKKAKNLRIFWVPLVNIRYIGELSFILAVLLKVFFTKELKRVDLVNSIGPRGLLAGWYLKRKYRIPLVCTIEMLNEKGTLIDNIIYSLSRLLLTRMPIDKIICWSNYCWESYLKEWGIPAKKVEIIPAGIDLQVYYPSIKGSKIKKKYAPKSPLIVFAKPLYNHNTQAAKLLVRSVALLRSEIEVRLLVGGGAGKGEVQALAGELGISGQVDFMPFVSFPKIPQYLAAADLIVLPFTYPSTTARSLLEAMAMGKPIITTPVGEIRRMLKHRVHALLVKNQPEHLAKAIKALIQNKNLAKRLGCNARNLAITHYSLESLVNCTVNCFNEVVN